jgi:hypothetical protein
MARWSETPADLVQINRVVHKLKLVGLVLVTLRNGSSIEGWVTRDSIENNAGVGGWRSRGEVELRLLDGSLRTIDYLDIESAANVWKERHEEFERAGLIVPPVA